MFANRKDAGVKLAAKLNEYKNLDVVVLGIPRGGLPIGAIVAEALDAPLDVVLVKKIGLPINKEYAIGAVSLKTRILKNVKNISERYIEEETNAIREVLAKRYEDYYKHCQPQNLRGKVIILVDDGIATGNTILATIGLLRKEEPSKIVVAVPVAPPSTITLLEQTPGVDEVVCLYSPDNFGAVGQFYNEFYAVTDEEAIGIFEKYCQRKQK